MAQIAYASTDWAHLVAKAKSQPSFATEFLGAKKKWHEKNKEMPEQNVVAAEWLPEHLVDQILTGYEVERRFAMITSGEFETKYKCKIHEVPGLEWHHLIDETGKAVKALIVEHPLESFRTFTFKTRSAFELDSSVAQSADMLRRFQNRDLMQELLKQGQHQCPSTSGLTFSKLQTMVEEEVAKKAAAAKAAASQPAPLAAADQERSEAAKEADSMVVDMVGPTAASMALGREQLGVTSGRGKGSSKSRKTKGGADAQSASDSATKRAKANPASDTASLASGKTSLYGVGSTTKADKKLLDQCARWIRELSIDKALVGSPMKNAIYQARRTLDQIGDPTSAHFLELQDAREAVLAAEKLASLTDLGKAERQNLLEHVTAYHTQPLPSQFQVNLLLTVLRENALVNNDDVSAWIDMCFPVVAKQGWLSHKTT